MGAASVWRGGDSARTQVWGAGDNILQSTSHPWKGVSLLSVVRL